MQECGNSPIVNVSMIDLCHWLVTGVAMIVIDSGVAILLSHRRKSRSGGGGGGGGAILCGGHFVSTARTAQHTIFIVVETNYLNSLSTISLIIYNQLKMDSGLDSEGCWIGWVICCRSLTDQVSERCDSLNSGSDRTPLKRYARI